MRLRPSSDASPARITDRLRSYYDADVDRRDAVARPDWKIDERAAFLDRLRAAEAVTLLEVGAGAGQDSTFFAGEGLDVTAVDLSPAMVDRIRAKGLRALVGDVRELGLPPRSFDAVYTFNALLHVPNTDLPAALAAIREVLKPGGLCYVGVYGAEKSEEGFSDDGRFFSFRGDHDLFAYAQEQFEVLDFHLVQDGDLRFQSMTLVRP